MNIFLWTENLIMLLNKELTEDYLNVAIAPLAGIRPSWGIDVNPTNRTKFNLSQMCSDYNEINHGSHVIRRSLLDIDISELKETDIIWASLPCDSLREDAIVV